LSVDPRLTALDRLRALRTRLQTPPGTVGVPKTGEDCHQLIRAVEAFHVEAIRFRMYGLRRKLTSDGADVPAEIIKMFEEAQDALEAAGFKIR